MLHPTPQATRLTDASAVSPTWAEITARLENAQFYWLATVRPEGRPHVVPVLGIWLDDQLHFVAGPFTRKARNLTRNPHATITVDSDDLHLVVEGLMAKIQDDACLCRLAEEYLVKYGWHVTIRDGVFYGDGAPTAGPPPYEVYRLTMTTLFAFATDDRYAPTRWRFPQP
jgi:nitroimidazol reductase NimA-like FMN-containing flavoprotein (pyridoxamine 5'-phosphate oxidase superfamily)